MPTATATATAKAIIANDAPSENGFFTGTETAYTNCWFVDAVKDQLRRTLPGMVLENSMSVQKEDGDSRIVCTVGSVKILFCVSGGVPTDVGIEFLTFVSPGISFRGEIWYEMVLGNLTLQFITDEGIASTEVSLPCQPKDKFVLMLKSLGDCCMPVLHSNVEGELKGWAETLPALMS